MVLPPQRDMERVEFGDKRLNERCQRIMEMYAESPESSFPDMMGSQADIEALYRFLRNPSVEPDEIIRAHAQATNQRLRDQSNNHPLMIHDSTNLHFGEDGRREDIGQPYREQAGFVGHFSLVVDHEKTRHPLGVPQFTRIFRTDDDTESRQWEASQEHWPMYQDKTGESVKWPYGVERSLEYLDDDCDPIHLMDRGAMSYRFVSWMSEHDHRFIIRLTQPHRRIEQYEGEVYLKKALDKAPVCAERQVQLSARRDKWPPNTRDKHPPRQTRQARLRIRAANLVLQRPGRLSSASGCPTEQPVNVVYVREVGAEHDQTPVEWMLATSESISSREDVERVIDRYRARWVIEQLHRALKSGCRIEDRQLRTKKTLLTAVAMALPVAWHLLAMRTVASKHPETPATQVMPVEYLEVLENEQLSRWPDGSPTVTEALWCIAELGGHLRQNGPPGWMTLTRGYRKLLTKAKAYKKAKNSITKEIINNLDDRDESELQKLIEQSIESNL